MLHLRNYVREKRRRTLGAPDADADAAAAAGGTGGAPTVAVGVVAEAVGATAPAPAPAPAASAPAVGLATVLSVDELEDASAVAVDVGGAVNGAVVLVFIFLMFALPCADKSSPSRARFMAVERARAFFPPFTPCFLRGRKKWERNHDSTSAHANQAPSFKHSSLEAQRDRFIALVGLAALFFAVFERAVKG